MFQLKGPNSAWRMWSKLQFGPTNAIRCTGDRKCGRSWGALGGGCLWMCVCRVWGRLHSSFQIILFVMLHPSAFWVNCISSKWQKKRSSVSSFDQLTTDWQRWERSSSSLLAMICCIYRTGLTWFQPDMLSSTCEKPLSYLRLCFRTIKIDRGRLFPQIGWL